MKGELILLSFILSSLLSGCGPTPRSVGNGRIYFLNNGECIHYRNLADSSIDCYDKKGNYQGNHRPMSQQELGLWTSQQQETSRAISNFSQSAAQAGEDFNRTAAYMARTEALRPQPYVMPLMPLR